MRTSFRNDVVQLDLKSSANGLYQLMVKSKLRPQFHEREVKLDECRRPRHNMDLGDYCPSIRSNILWLREGLDPSKFKQPQQPIELQVLTKRGLKRFHGEGAMKRLTFVSPAVFARMTKYREGGVGKVLLSRNNMVLRLSEPTLRRSLKGASGKNAFDICEASFKLPGKIKNRRKSERFYEAVSMIFIYFRLLYEMSVNLNEDYLKLRNVLIQNMFDEGLCQSSIIQTYSRSLYCILSGRSRNDFERWILKQPRSERVCLWKTRRILVKDDNDELENIRRAIERMTGDPWGSAGVRQPLAMRALDIFQCIASKYVQDNLDRLRERHDTTPLHRSSASLYFTRAQGGGASELALITGLYRLSRGIPSPLVDVYGPVGNTIDVEDVWKWTVESSEQRKEMLSACEWFIDHIKRNQISFPYLCIFPEREPKSRTFMILPYALQQAGSQAASVLSEFFRTFSDTEEVFRGFKDHELVRRIKKDLGDPNTTTIMSLDSATATDPLPYEYCLAIFRPFYPCFSEYTIKGLENIFSPHLVHPAEGRPRSIMDLLPFTAEISERLKFKVNYIDVVYSGKLSRVRPLTIFEDRVPNVRLKPHAIEIAQNLIDHNRILLKSPTGSGKTVLAASLFRSIIQFPSVAAIEIFSGTLTHFQIPHVKYYSRVKEEAKEQLKYFAPTILCTAFYIEQLHHKFPEHVIVLDEAESKQERAMYNIAWTRFAGARTLLMSATPEEIKNEEDTFVLEIGNNTNFPISENTCTEREMIEMISNKNVGKFLICTYSEPHCYKLSQLISDRNVVVLNSQRRQTDYLASLSECDGIISTNVIRASVTLPDLEEVFDLCRVYESVDFPLEGFESLVLFQTSKSMEIQLKGRVGRTRPGKYWKVQAERPAERYTPRVLARCPFLASRLGSFPMTSLPREVNVGSLIIEKLSQDMISKSFEVDILEYRPPWVSLFLSRVCNVDRKHLDSLVFFIGFEEFRIANRIQQLKDNEEMSFALERFKDTNNLSYVDRVYSFLKELRRNPCGFDNEIFQIDNCLLTIHNFYSETYELDDHNFNQTSDWLTSIPALLILSSALWRQVAKLEGKILQGVFRNFSVSTPTDFVRENEDYFICVGLTLAQGALLCKSLIPLPIEVFECISNMIEYSYEINTDVQSDLLVTYGTSQPRRGKQQKQTYLQVNKYSTSHVFMPNKFEFICEQLELAQKARQVGPSRTTTRGSPMSSTASFSVLNGLGLAANMLARELTKENLSSASVFGDDSIVVGSRTACDIVRRTREQLGLQTKEEATGYLDINDLEQCENALAVFTERMFTYNGDILHAHRPNGLVRLYQAYHHNHLLSRQITYLPDMVSYDEQIRREQPKLYEFIRKGSLDVRDYHARRETAPRYLLRRGFSSRIKPNDHLAAGADVKRLIDHLESVVLMRFPSTRGLPARVLNPEESFMKIPPITYQDAVLFAERLQGNGCYFKLRGPPLKFTKANFAITEARKIACERGRETPRAQLLSELGWGDMIPLKDSEETPIVASEIVELD